MPDEAAIGMVNSKTTAVRLIPAIGLAEGEELDFGGLLGRGPVMKLAQRILCQDDSPRRPHSGTDAELEELGLRIWTAWRGCGGAAAVQVGRPASRPSGRAMGRLCIKLPILPIFLPFESKR